MQQLAVWPEVDVFDDHRLWRPEWTDDRSCLYWYLTFVDKPAVAALADRARGRLGDLAAIDVVPSPWLHLTLCDVGFLEDLDPGLLEQLTRTVADELRRQSALELTLGPVGFFSDSVTLAVEPSSALRQLRRRIGRAMKLIGLEPQHHRASRFTPHVTLGYVNRRIDKKSVLDSLGEDDASGTVQVDHLTLAAVRRRHGHYEWDTGAILTLGGARSGQAEGTGVPSRTGSESTP